ncbi:hypothetical protein [Sphingomonas nostoxanthinifaciens]|uniref:hypothetical protein n=1 Tax=Sphingomonas nostoxanthinifaciens TaxID=2872652 RepID=UPI001CC1DFB3|nr:hypothetical protein [Sphingomonas nostoxanthinifaciens]UAK24345.1 hypothetical protein K8P63_18865 [Sphingomonas nostoxanthinifaciens]
MKAIGISAVFAAALATCVSAQTTSPMPPPIPAASAAAANLPANTVVPLISAEEISSINMKVGDTHQLQVASDITEGGKVVIPRGAAVATVVTWRTGKGIGGKSASSN